MWPINALETYYHKHFEPEPRHHGWDIAKRSGEDGLIGLACFAAGAAAMYLLDPQQGRARRARLWDQINKQYNTTSNTATKRARDTKNRAQGVASKLKSKFATDEVPDNVIAERVRSALGHATGNARSIRVVVDQGNVTLFGPWKFDEIDAVVKAAGAVRGVKSVSHDFEPTDAARM